MIAARTEKRHQMNERNRILYKLLDTIFFGEHDNPGDKILHDLWAGFAAVGLIAVGGRLWNLTGWRGLLRVILYLAGVWLIGLFVRLWFRDSNEAGR
jgi:hypothetical protein